MSADTSEDRSQFTDGVRPAGPDRPRWIVAVAVVAVVVAVLALVAARARTTTADTQGGRAGASGSSEALTCDTYTSRQFQPAFTWKVPAWASGTGVIVTEHVADTSWNKPEGCDPRCEWLSFLTPKSVKLTSAGQVHPVSSAEDLADHIRALGKAGPITIKTEHPMTVDGMKATEFVFDERAFTPDAFACADAKGSDCYPISSDMTSAAVVLDVAGEPVIIVTSGLTVNPDGDLYRQQFEQALTTVAFTGATTPAPAPFAVKATSLEPPLAVELPSWAATSEKQEEPGAYNYTQTVCGASPCAENTGRGIRLYTVHFMYPLDSDTIVSDPGYAREVSAYRAVQTLGYGRVSDIRATRVGGRPATVLTVALTREIFGLARCPSRTSAKADCAHAVAGRVQRVAIIDNGKGKPVTLLFESWNRSADPDDAVVIAEFDRWLSTVKFHG